MAYVGTSALRAPAPVNQGVRLFSVPERFHGIYMTKILLRTFRTLKGAEQ